MYLWKVDNLVEDLKSGAVNQGDQAKYILVNILLLLFISDPLFFVGTKYTSMDTASSIWGLIISLLGLQICYRSNGGNSGEDFLLRFISLSVPIIIRFSAIVIPIGIVLGAIIGVEYIPDDKEVYTTSIYEVVIFGITDLIFFLYFASKLKLCKKFDEPPMLG